MGRLIAFYVSALLALTGFLAAGITAGAPAAVLTGTLGLLGFYAATAARIAAQAPPAVRRAARVGGGT